MAEYVNKAHYGTQGFTWDPSARVFSGGIEHTSPGYLTELLALQDRVRGGTAKPWEAEELRRYETEARAIPTRDIGSLTAGWQGELQGGYDESGWRPGQKDWWSHLDPMSPDVGPIVLQLRDKIERGQATPQEQALFKGVTSMGGEWDYRASRPQPSDAFNPLGDQFFGALGTLALGATGGLAAAPLAAGGAGLTTTLGSLGTLAGTAGTAAGALGREMEQPWLQKLGMGLGAAGGIAGGIGGLANLARTGVQSLGDAARLASNAGRVVGGVGAIADNDVLRQAGGWLGTAGQLGGGVEAFRNVLGGDMSALVPGVRQFGGGVQGLLKAAQQAQQRGRQVPGPGQPVPRTMAPADWLRMRAQPRPMPRTVLGNL